MNSPQTLDVFHCSLEGINLIEASAGTGKTWNICGLYLRLLLERAWTVQQILVVTFTNPATAELRERIRLRIVQTLQALQTGPASAGDPFVERLLEALRASGCQTEKMAQQLDLALQTFDEAAIFTIHGFCQKALADTPFSSGLPLKLELIQDDRDLRMQVVSDYWRQHIAGQDLPALLAQFLIDKKDSPEKYATLLERHLAKPLAQVLWPESDGSSLEALSQQYAQAYQEAQKLWRATGDDAQHPAQILHQALNLKQLHGATYKPHTIDHSAQEWSNLLGQDRPPLSLAFDSAALKLFTLAHLTSKTLKNKSTPHHPFFEQAENLLSLMDALLSNLQYRRLQLIRHMVAQTTKKLREHKHAQAIVSFDDMLFNLHDRLSSGAYPSLAQEIRKRFPAALIDEFQDTDPLQFAIFQRLYLHDPSASLFWVGDPKQAIYSFRHADLHTYLHAKSLATAQYSLNKNQRSSAGLIDGLNALFTQHAQAFMLPGLTYPRVERGDKPLPLWSDTSAKADEAAQAAVQVWMLPTDASHEPLLTRAQAKQAAAQATAAEVSRLLRQAQAGTLQLDSKPLRAGDMAILVRSHAQGSDIKKALSALNISSVELAQASVFQSTDAQELLQILRAVLQPQRLSFLRNAWATSMMGLDATGIEALQADDAHLSASIQEFVQYRQIWMQSGVAAMLNMWMQQSQVISRQLSRSDGERRLTNLRHLIECLQQAEATHRAPAALLRWLEAQRQNQLSGEEAQLRLESDQNLVKIITIHKSKGLEYPLVFCPFLWDGHNSNNDKGLDSIIYHDTQHHAVIDYRKPWLSQDEWDDIKAKTKIEQAAEQLRLIYVALTRAIHRCVLIAGTYTTAHKAGFSSTQSTHSLLNWLVAGEGLDPHEWYKAQKSPVFIQEAWQRLQQRLQLDSPQALSLAPLALINGLPVQEQLGEQASLQALARPRSMPSAWRMSSYSGLMRGARQEYMAADHDTLWTQETEVPSMPSPSLDPRHSALDILHFPRGAAAGDCIHAVFERIDFTQAQTWSPAITQALQLFAPKNSAPQNAGDHEHMLLGMLEQVMQTELLPGLQLSQLAASKRLIELEFNLPVEQLFAHKLQELLSKWGYPVPILGFSDLQGYLHGFIDLVFEHQGRFYLLDWKSNHLGFDPQDYQQASIQAAMAQHGYHLQSLIYALSVHRYLKRRKRQYDHAQHFGGIFYLFVRGVRPDWPPQSGVYFHQPQLQVLDELSALLQPELN